MVGVCLVSSTVGGPRGPEDWRLYARTRHDHYKIRCLNRNLLLTGSSRRDSVYLTGRDRSREEEGGQTKEQGTGTGTSRDVWTKTCRG